MSVLYRSAKTLLLFLAFFGLHFTQVNAQPENSAPELILNVKPSLCLRYSSGEDCKLSVEVVWRDTSPSNYCLYSAQDLEPVRCWEDIAEASLEEDREISEDLVYWLTKPGENARLVTATVEMATIVEDDKRSRSRRRHVWNLI